MWQMINKYKQIMRKLLLILALVMGGASLTTILADDQITMSFIKKGATQTTYLQEQPGLFIPLRSLAILNSASSAIPIII